MQTEQKIQNCKKKVYEKIYSHTSTTTLIILYFGHFICHFNIFFIYFFPAQAFLFNHQITFCIFLKFIHFGSIELLFIYYLNNLCSYETTKWTQNQTNHPKLLLYQMNGVNDKQLESCERTFGNLKDNSKRIGDQLCGQVGLKLNPYFLGCSINALVRNSETTPLPPHVFSTLW